MIPQRRAHAEVLCRESVVALVVFQQRCRESARAVMCSIMNKEIPRIGDQRARKERPAGEQINKGKADPYLPKNTGHRFIRMSVMKTVFYRGKVMQHETMDGILSKGPSNEAACDQRHAIAGPERRPNR